MSLTQEHKEKEIARECAVEYVNGNLTIVDTLLHFLSRLREGQEAIFWTDSEMDCTDTITFTKTEDNNVPLFTIPPAAPDCKGLVEALEMALEWIDAVPMDIQLPAMPGFDRDYVDGLLTKHKASMGEK